MSILSARSLRAAMVATVAVLLASVARADDVKGSKDHPLVSRFKGAEIVDYASKDFDEAVLPVQRMDSASPYPPSATMKVEGKVTRITYRLPARRSAVEAMRNYQQALSSDKVIFHCAGDECGGEFAGFVGNSGKVIPPGWSATFNTENNRYALARKSLPSGDVYILLYAMQENAENPVTVYEEVVEVRPMQTGQVTVLDAPALDKGLRSEGHVAVYGLYFDTGKAEVKPESKPTLDQMARLLAQQPALKVYLVGHTDNVGPLATNLDLSQRRAEAVAKALATDYKVDASRMTARGVASLAPLASNADEPGRARNRRVELVQQ